MTAQGAVVEVRRVGPVATVWLNRPEVRNAFNQQMITSLTDSFRELSEDATVEVVVLRGRGKSFCAGADIAWMRASLGYSMAENVADAERMSDMFAAIDTCIKPVVAVVHGAALGGGMGLIAVCDIVVAEESTLFGFTEVKLGILPAVISRFVAPKIGEGWSRALFLTGERFDARRAQGVGLVHQVVLEGNLQGALQGVLDDLGTAGPQATQEVKRLLRVIRGRPDDEVRTLTAESIARVRTSPEGQEGLKAFLERRPAEWHRDLTAGE